MYFFKLVLCSTTEFNLLESVQNAIINTYPKFFEPVQEYPIGFEIQWDIPTQVRILFTVPCWNSFVMLVSWE